MVSNLKVDKIQSVAGTTTAMTIDSSGRVLLPQLIAFHGKKTDTDTYNTIGQAIPFNQTKLAHSAWNGTTFTAPIAGTYRFFVNGHHQSAGGTTFELAIYKNGSSYETSYNLSDSSHRSRASVEAILNLAVSDTIDFRLLQGDVYGGSGGGSGIMCTGHLLG